MCNKLLSGNLLRHERKKLGEVMDKAGFYFVQRDVAVKEFFERGGFAVGDATGNDEVEETQVGANVVGKTVRCNPAADVHTDGGEFFFLDIAGQLHPSSGLAGNAVSGNAKVWEARIMASSSVRTYQ